MCVDWLTVATVFLGFCALAAPYVAGLTERTVFAPNLRFLFDLDSPYCHKTTTLKGTPVYYCRFKIENSYVKGRFHRASQARNCEAVLESMWKYDSSGNLIKVKNFTPVNLNMGPQMTGTTKFIDLNPSRGIFCDIGQVYQNEKRFTFDLLEHYNAQIDFEHLDPGEKCILQYGVYSGNSKHNIIYFNISWSGNWKDNPEEMFKELVIAPTNKPRD